MKTKSLKDSGYMNRAFKVITYLVRLGLTVS